MKKLLLLTLSIGALSLGILSCNKEPGQGGRAIIKGRIFENLHTTIYPWGIIDDSIPATNKKVYLLHGLEDSTYDDDFNTSYDGSFEFKYLTKGDYQIFVYTKQVKEDSSGIENAVHKINLNISERKQVINVGDIYIDKF